MPTAAKAKAYRFKLLAGIHVMADPDWTRPRDEDGKLITAARAPNLVFKAGDGRVIETDTDLVAKFGPDKFQLLSGPSKTKTVKVPAGMASLVQREAVNDHPGAVEVPSGDEAVDVVVDADNPAAQSVAESYADGKDDEPEAAAAPAPAKKPAAKKVNKDLEAVHGDLTKKTLPDLKALADKEGVDLSGAHTKAEVIAALKGE